MESSLKIFELGVIFLIVGYGKIIICVLSREGEVKSLIC